MSIVQKMKEAARSEMVKCLAAGKKVEQQMSQSEYLCNCLPDNGKEMAAVTAVGVTTASVAALAGAGFFGVMGAGAAGYVAGGLALGAVKTKLINKHGTVSSQHATARTAHALGLDHQGQVKVVAEELKSLFRMVEEQS